MRSFSEHRVSADCLRKHTRVVAVLHEVLLNVISYKVIILENISVE